jgi:general secretion pathway protein B
MSYILDALRRAERERQAGHTPVPVGAPAAAPPPRGKLPRRLVLGVVVALVVAVAAGSLIAWRKHAKSVRGSTAARPPATLAQRPPRPAFAPAVPQATPAQPAETPAVIPGTESVSSLDDLTQEQAADLGAETPAPPPLMPPPAASRAPAPKPQPAQPAPQRPPAAREAAPASAAPAAAPPPAAETAPAPKAQPRTPAPDAAETPPPAARTQAPAEMPPALTRPVPLRTLREMPPEYRADFPPLSVDVHVYEKAPEKRFVIINGRKYHQGERLNEGPQLVEIVSNGIVVEYRGEKVTYPIAR